MDGEPAQGESREKTVGVSDFTLLGRRFRLQTGNELWVRPCAPPFAASAGLRGPPRCRVAVLGLAFSSSLCACRRRPRPAEVTREAPVVVSVNSIRPQGVCYLFAQWDSSFLPP